ncbi:MAG: response regulator [Mycobacteriaceae bacterium]
MSPVDRGGALPSRADVVRAADLTGAYQAVVEGLRHLVLRALDGLAPEPGLLVDTTSHFQHLTSLLWSGRKEGPQVADVAGPQGSTPIALPEILIVDDDASCRLLVEAVLTGMRVVNPQIHLRDGDAVLTYLQACESGAVLPPALVLLDGDMPGRTGFEVLRWLHGRPLLAGVPVVMLTGTSDVASIREAYAYDAASYLVKPVAFDALQDVLRSLERPWALL